MNDTDRLQGAECPTIEKFVVYAEMWFYWNWWVRHFNYEQRPSQRGDTPFQQTNHQKISKNLQFLSFYKSFSYIICT